LTTTFFKGFSVPLAVPSDHHFTNKALHLIARVLGPILVNAVLVWMARQVFHLSHCFFIFCPILIYKRFIRREFQKFPLP
jgi:hypothetical protein